MTEPDVKPLDALVADAADALSTLDPREIERAERQSPRCRACGAVRNERREQTVERLRKQLRAKEERFERHNARVATLGRENVKLALLVKRLVAALEETRGTAEPVAG